MITLKKSEKWKFWNCCNCDVSELETWKNCLFSQIKTVFPSQFTNWSQLHVIKKMHKNNLKQANLFF